MVPSTISVTFTTFAAPATVLAVHMADGEVRGISEATLQQAFAGVQPNQLKLTGELLADLFLGKITKWNDTRLAAENACRMDSAITISNMSATRAPTSLGVLHVHRFVKRKLVSTSI